MRKITETKNIFKLLDIGHLENYHSNMLAWLFDVNGGGIRQALFILKI